MKPPVRPDAKLERPTVTWGGVERYTTVSCKLLYTSYTTIENRAHQLVVEVEPLPHVHLDRIFNI